MNEKDAFLADICESPDEDTPRLVFADWLDDHNEPDRAAFIRAQCSTAARQKASRHDPRGWAGPLGEWCERVFYHRGFVEEIHIQTHKFLERAEDIFRLAPIRLVRLVHLYSDHIAALARLPQLARLSVLQAHGNYRHAGCETLFQSPYLNDLPGLAVNDTPIGPAGLRALLESPSLSRLTHLHLGATSIRLEGINLLARSPKCQHLICLDLRGNGQSVRALRALDRSPYLGNLRRLGLWYNRLGDEGLIEFVRMPLFARLVHLSLGNNRFTARGLRALAEAPALQNIRTLWLGVDRYGTAGVEALIRSTYLHPDAKLGIWLNNNLAPKVIREAQQRLGDRVSFDHHGDTWDRDPSVGWPLWQP